ncbi:hypothetical protein BCAH187_C0055 (plasmid) [Bacillus cereus AH187]|uniref:Uncharacterized protein n=1 Tax=Bacillus cereus (strain AH187) TaxID=405534 RepID=B7I127_BACC7|nr:hypothetical protein BCAH187_C0055 [Bacillus cereus AH187]
MKDLLPPFATHGCWHIQKANGQTTLCFLDMLFISYKAR